MVEMMLDCRDEATPVKPMKLKFQVKAVAFILATLALSLFFEGWRQIHQTAALQSWLVLAAGVISTLFMLWLNGFFIYVEEKSRGTLTKRIKHYDQLADRFQWSKVCTSEPEKAVDKEKEETNGG